MTSNTNLHEILDPSRPLRAAALSNLSHLSEDERAELQRALPAASAQRRLRLAQDLVDLAEDNATLDFEAVFRLLLDDPNGTVRRLAIEGLWEVEDRSLIEPLVRLLTADPDPEVRAAAALALGRYVMLHEFEQVRPRDAERILNALRTVASDAAQPAQVRARAVEAVGASSEPWSTELIWRAFDAEEEALQVSAIHAMGRNGDPSWLPTLYDEMESDDPRRRFEAATAAGGIGDEDAVPHLADLIGDPDPEVQEAAVAALGEIGGELAMETLREHLPGSEPRLSEAIRAALADAQAADGLLGAGPLESAPEEHDDE